MSCFISFPTETETKGDKRGGDIGYKKQNKNTPFFLLALVSNNGAHLFIFFSEQLQIYSTSLNPEKNYLESGE
jgi:hypothetical protein